jgi:hypothetical protein
MTPATKVQANNPKVVFSNPAPATKEFRALVIKSWRFFV